MDNFVKCPGCLTDNPADSNFCLKCGFQIKEIPLSTSLFKQLGVYFVSFFLPPFGLIPALKYLRQNDPKLKNIGLIAIFLTFLSIVITIYLGISLFSSINTEVNRNLQNIPL